MAPQVPDKQWAQVVEQKGGPPVYKEIPVPKPGPDEVLVQIKYSGVCHTDLHAMKGDWPLPLKMPLVGGHEGAGIVVAKGELADGVEIGDHVGIKWLNGSCLACEYCKTAEEQLCAGQQLSGYTVDGTFQQYAIGKAAHVTNLPKDVSLDGIAPILCAGVTVYRGLKESAARPGQTVAIVGAGGGLGAMAQQYAKAMGLRVIAIDGGDEKREMCEKLGSEAYIDFTKSKDLIADVRAATPDNLGAHAVLLLAVSEKPFQQAVEYARPRGNIVAIGLPAHAFLKAPVFESVTKMINIKGSYVGNRQDAAGCKTTLSLQFDPCSISPLQVAKRLEKFKTTIFTQMSMLAIKHGAINLGQGFPNFDGPDFVKEAAIQAINAGKNQYARGFGVPELNSAIAERFLKDSGLQVDPDKEVTVTSGCTEAIASTILGLINPGDEVILFAPFYDSYEATLSMAGANVKAITLRAPDFAVPLEELEAAVSKNTKAIMINTPHNPTGKMFTREELEFIATLCKENDVLLFSDEVYDKLSFEADHISMASIPGMYERTVTMNSLGKTFSLTGWKIGWAIAPPHLTWGLRQAHSFLTFATCTPMQAAAAAALRAPDSYYEELKRDYSAKKAILLEGLEAAGFIVYPSSGTYFIMVDHTPFGFDNDIEFCEYLIREVGVAAIPPSVFYLNPEEGKNLVRFTFCKDEDTLRGAVERMKTRLRKK